ncbi:hypothetical protein [Rhodoferax sp. UBA5149]|uniref:hypothetical protein n=1 Tax=Rhodoferax sp. UBA5149 TaxID=1947379 RepID=UPI0025FF2ADA|nr:hypothetical protein [Rhodoferax sp. UBA5149]
MNATKPLPSKVNLAVTHVLAELLERLDNSTVPVGAEQYRSVVMHLVNEFNDVPSSVALAALLDTYPAATELYENLNYEVAGLCRSSLDLSLAAEQQAKAAINRAMGQST